MRHTREASTAATGDLASFAAQLTDRVLHCRELGHVWRPLTVRWDNASDSYDRRLRCQSCRTIRVQLVTSSGHPLTNRYEYPDGYLAVGTKGHTNRDAFRMEAITRFLHPKEGAA